MNIDFKPTAALASALLLVVTACSTTGAATTTTMENESVVIAVENTLVPGTAVTVEALALGSDSEQVLGTVGPLATEEFLYDPAAFRNEDFRLTATTTEGTEVVSPPFTLAESSVVAWDLSANQIDLGGS